MATSRGVRGTHWVRRVAAAGVIGITCFLAVVFGLGRGFSDVRGAADNGDGPRLYCGAGLVPSTPGSSSAWKGGVVLQFTVGQRCPDPIPSSALSLLRLSTIGSGSTYSLTRLGWLYAALLSGAAMIAAWASTKISLSRSLLLIPSIVPLAIPSYSRFLVSTYSEPAGLLGVFILLAGVCITVATDRYCRTERVIALFFVSVGSFIAATAKVAYVPVIVVGLIACILCRLQPRFSDRRVLAFVPGSGAALILVLALILPLGAAFSWQRQHTLAINTHNLIYTTVLVELPDTVSSLGLPASSVDFAGKAFYPDGRDGVDGADVIANSPSALRNSAWEQLLRHPTTLFKIIGVALQATNASSLEYLPSSPWTVATVPAELGESVGEQGADPEKLREWLDRMSVPWLPSATVVAGVVVAVLGVFRRDEQWSGFGILAGVSAVSGTLLAATAVLGDGYFEISKHVWLAAYFIAVCFCSLACMAVCALNERWRLLIRCRIAGTRRVHDR